MARQALRVRAGDRIRIQKSGFRGQRLMEEEVEEGRGQRAEVRGQRSEVRGQRSEVRGQRRGAKVGM